ncbi:hypothetical protein ABT112_07835 [Streptomyces sp. NPDC002055]|uniref:hypothetical protein n=1 Tax=Streptomyces sp. NPDC002055 TaxID=3154534 RepID=UPI0033325472
MHDEHTPRGCPSTPQGGPTEQPPIPLRTAVARRLAAAAARSRRSGRGLAGWLFRRRRVAADQFLRGACYGAGTAVVGLLAVWAQTR